jgi:CheY-like chemotaxis protein
VAVVLVVDDDSRLRGLLCRGLAQRGHTPIPAGTGADALAGAARRSPDVALLDLRLPDTDGPTLFRALRRDQPKIIGVIMTAYASVPNAVECLHAGIAEYLEKPFTLEAMVTLVERLAVDSIEPGAAEAPTQPMVVPAYQRLGLAIVRGIEDLSSITSFPAWGRVAGGAESTVRSWCKAARVRAKSAEDFRRGLAAAIAAPDAGVPARDLLGYVDPRSIERFLARCGPLQEGGTPWTPEDYCRKQRVLQQPAVVNEVMRLLRLRGLIGQP